MPNTTTSKRVENEAELVDLVGELRATDRSIALTNGCYDVLHVGHLRALKDAKRQADVLIVALNSDASVGQWKGPGYPVVPEDERAELIAGIGCVDHVYVFGDPSVDGLLETIRPDAYCKGPEYTMQNLPERDTVHRLGLRFCNVGDPKDHSSTTIVERVAEAYGVRAVAPGTSPATAAADALGAAPAASSPTDDTARRVEILSRKRLFSGFLDLDEVHLRHETPGRSMSPEMMRLNVERGDGAGVLLVNTDRNTVVLTRQFRYAVWERDGARAGGGGWLLEVPAGTVAVDRDPEDVARAEVAEEVGYTVRDLHYLTTFYASPGTTTERVILYEATVTDADRRSDGGGLAHEHEYIEVVEMPIDDALRGMETGVITDAKTVIALQRLQTRRERDGR